MGRGLENIFANRWMTFYRFIFLHNVIKVILNSHLNPYTCDCMVFFNVKLEDSREIILKYNLQKNVFLPHVWRVKNPQSAGKCYICDWVKYSFCWLDIPYSRVKGSVTNYVDKILPNIIAIYLYLWGNWFPKIREMSYFHWHL